LIEDKREDESKVYLSRAEKNLAPTERKGSVLQGAAIQRWEPIYPQDARAARARGPVVVEVTVNECGRVIAARAITGNALLKPAAEDAARRWRFTPTRLENIPVKVIGTITFIFNL
jgi:TonB family protein